MSAHEPLIFAVIVLVAATIAFACAVALLNAGYRVVAGRFFRWFGRGVWIALAIYLAAWIALLFLLLTSPNAFLITH